MIIYRVLSLAVLSCVLSSAASAQNPSMPIPPGGSTFSSSVRGLWFVAPTDFTIVGLRVPDDFSQADQSIQVVSLPATPPVFSATTTVFTTLHHSISVPGVAVIPVSIPVLQNEIIGVMGQRGTVTSYANVTGPVQSSIGAHNVTLTRFFAQQNINVIPATEVSQNPTGAIGRIEIYYTVGNAEIGVDFNSIPVSSSGIVNVGNARTQIGETYNFDVLNAIAATADLNLPGVPPVAVTLGLNCAATTGVQVQPPLTTITAGSSTTFTVYVEPQGPGPFSLLVSIANNDPANNPFEFTLEGVGVLPNGPAFSALAPGSSLANPQPGIYTLGIDPGASLVGASIELLDPESDDVIISAIDPPPVIVAGINAPSIPGSPSHPVVLEWTGMADPINDPAAYVWLVHFQDTVNGTANTATITITINDVAPEHAIADAGSGNGSVGSPYTTGFTHGDTGANAVDLATVSDPNSSQLLMLGSVTADPANPTSGSGFAFSLGTFLTVAPAGPLQTADIGTHSFEVEVSDQTNTISIFVAVEVVGLSPTFTSQPILTATPGEPYVYSAAATGIPAPGLSTGVLPPWLSFNAAAGELSGTPPTSASKNTFSIVLTASNGVAPDAVQAFDIVVGSVPGGTTSDGSSGGGCASGTRQGIALFALFAVAISGLGLRRKRSKESPT